MPRRRRDGRRKRKIAPCAADSAFGPLDGSGRLRYHLDRHGVDIKDCRQGPRRRPLPVPWSSFGSHRDRSRSRAIREIASGTGQRPRRRLRLHHLEKVRGKAQPVGDDGEIIGETPGARRGTTPWPSRERRARIPRTFASAAGSRAGMRVFKKVLACIRCIAFERGRRARMVFSLRQRDATRRGVRSHRESEGRISAIRSDRNGDRVPAGECLESENQARGMLTARMTPIRNAGISADDGATDSPQGERIFTDNIPKSQGKRRRERNCHCDVLESGIGECCGYQVDSSPGGPSEREKTDLSYPCT